MADIPSLDKELIERIFDEAASAYNRIGPDIYTQFAERLVGRISLVPDAHVLDIATGTGAVLLPVARRVGTEGRIVGTDISSSILAEAESALRAAGTSHIELCKMDAECLEFPDNSFDVVTCAFGLFFFPDMEAALREIYRVCRPGGYIALSLFSNACPMFEPGMPAFIQQCLAYETLLMLPQKVITSPEETENNLSRAGFLSCESQVERYEFVYESLDDWWGFLMTLAPRAMYLRLDDKRREQFKDEYMAAMEPLLAADGLHVTVAVLYALARK